MHTALSVQRGANLPNILCNQCGNRTEMARSVEARVPFLNHPLTEYVNQLPPSVKIRYPTDEWILREAVKHQFLAPPAEAKTTPHGIYLNKRLTREAVEALG